MMMNKHLLLKRILELDFVAVDLQLYLNTHPGDKEALYKFNLTVTQAQMLRQEYEKMCGPLCSYRSPSGYPWQWINNPWPWDYQFNYKLTGKEL